MGHSDNYTELDIEASEVSNLPTYVDGNKFSSSHSESEKGKSIKQIDLLRNIARSLDQKKAEDLIAIDVRGFCQIADYFLFVKGSVAKHLDALSTEALRVGKSLSGSSGRYEGQGDSWQIVDIEGIMIHVMTEHARREYQLEKLWPQAASIELSLEGEGI